MNQWDCDFRDCKSSAVGVGGAAGLHAIGWWFEPGPMIRCPAHWPESERRPCTDPYTPDGEKLESCSLCPAEGRAEFWQDQINDHHRWPRARRRPTASETT